MNIVYPIKGQLNRVNLNVCRIKEDGPEVTIP